MFHSRNLHGRWTATFVVVAIIVEAIAALGAALDVYALPIPLFMQVTQQNIGLFRGDHLFRVVVFSADVERRTATAGGRFESRRSHAASSVAAAATGTATAESKARKVVLLK